MREWVASFDDFRADTEDFIDGGDCVVVPMVLRGRVRGSQEEVSMRETWVWKVRDGLVAEIHEFATLEEALKAVASLAEPHGRPPES
jgi:ketosteroid isomerase-like protein